MLSDLIQMSARLGDNFELVQGAGGNTSAKDSEHIWVKSSGRVLADANQEMIFLPLSLDCRKAIIEDPSTDVSRYIVDPDKYIGLRPSIETALHAILDHTFVAHVHAMNTIAASIQPSLNDRIDEVLCGLNWVRIPYRKPGEELATNIISATQNTEIDIIILDNHGLVCGGDTTEKVESLICEVEARLAPLMNSRFGTDSNMATPTTRINEPGYEYVSDDTVQQLAFDEIALEALSAGSLYPDHVVFLGPGVAIAREGESMSDAVARSNKVRGASVKSIIVPGVGVFAQAGLNEQSLTMLYCLARIGLRLQSGTVTSLTNSDELALVDWEAEQYRRSLKT